LVAEYRLNLFPYEDLVIYEIGAGNGTLMGDILDYIAAEDPEVYDRTRYRIIEISGRLQELQKGRVRGGNDDVAMKATARGKGHASKVEVLGGSIFDWDKIVPEPCFFLALEVLVSTSSSFHNQ
jgi:SAM-dependent MidA family methyltransferase